VSGPGELGRPLQPARGAFGWCCSYCSAPLEPRPFGLFCAAEGRYFATDRGVHRLLPEARRRELLPFLELDRRVRRDEGWSFDPGAPQVAPEHPRAREWRARARRFRAGVALAREVLGAPPWRVLDLGAGCGWGAACLARQGHLAAAIDVDPDEQDGLGAADRLAGGVRLERAEAEMEALPLEPRAVDLVVACASLHYAEHLVRTLVELRRVTRRGGALLVIDSPVFPSREAGESAVRAQRRALARRYGLSLTRDARPGYLARDELESSFTAAGWRLSLRAGRPRAREARAGTPGVARHERNAARLPILLGRREG
jgi:SAM-dependent methyltransferase